MNMMYIEDCCEILDSMRVPITASDRKKGEYPYYGANGIQDYVSDYIFDDELVLLAEDGGNFGSKEKPIAYRVSGKCWVNNHAHVLKPKVGLTVDYLCYSLMFYNVEGIINGATRQKLTQSAMRKMKIPVRTMKEQIQIVDKLNRIIRIKEQRKQELSELDTLIKARFVEMFGDPVLNSFGWCRVSLSEVTSKIGSGATPKGGKESYRSEGISLIRSMNVHDGKFKYKDLAHITEKQAKQLNNVIVEENDVLVNITGASIARTCVVPKNVLPARVNQHVAIIRCDCEQVQPVFLNNLFLNIRFKKMLLSMGENGGATRQAITKQQLENIDVIVPPLSLQNEFADFVQQIDKLRFGCRKLLAKSKNIQNLNRNTIMLERSALYGK